MNSEIIKQSWQNIKEHIRDSYGLSNISYKTWIEDLEIAYVRDNVVVIRIPSDNQFKLTYISKNYSDFFKVTISELLGEEYDVQFILEQEEAQPEEQMPAPVKPANMAKIEDAHLHPKYRFDTFIVGSNNMFAHSACLAVSESPGNTYNPLFLYGGAGLGKTHLMHSIAHFILQNNPEAKVLYVTSEEFTNELIDSIRNNSTNNSVMSRFRDKYRNIDVLLIDDIQFLINKASTQEEFFHTFEALYGAKKQIIISSDKPPKDLDVLEERIRSRLEMGLIADISLPDYETRMAILKKKEDLDGYHIDNAILDYIAKNIKSNIRELEGCLNRIRAKSILEKRTITLDLAEEILKDMISPDENRAVTSTMIIDAVAEHFHLTPQEIRSQKRDTKYVYPRKIAMYLCRVMTEDSLMTIAGYLNKKDHTTVISACRKIEKEMTTNPETRNNVETIKKKISPAK